MKNYIGPRNSAFWCESFGFFTLVAAILFFRIESVAIFAVIFLVYMGGSSQNRGNRLRKAKRDKLSEAQKLRDLEKLRAEFRRREESDSKSQ